MNSKMIFCFIWLATLLNAEVFDCFTFFNEVELLKLRLKELDDVVDHFVLVESPTSFTGKPKPLYYQENAHLFQKFHSKIIHIVIDSFPELNGEEEIKLLTRFPHLKEDAEKKHWFREGYSREAILQGLNGCKDSDVIIISDLDEIPRAEAVLRIKEYLSQFDGLSDSQRTTINNSELVCGLDMRLFMYSMNLENSQGWYGGSKATPYWVLRQHSPWGIKLFHHKYAMHKIPNAGWHFNTMGGKDLSLYKWLYTGPIYYPGVEEAIYEMAAKPELLQQSYDGHVAYHTVVVPIDDTYPKYFLDNIEHFREIGWIVEPK